MIGFMPSAAFFGILENSADLEQTPLNLASDQGPRCLLYRNVKSFLELDIKRTRTFEMTNEPQHDKTNNMACAPSEDSAQPGHPPCLIRVFAVPFMRSSGPNDSSCGQRRV